MTPKWKTLKPHSTTKEDLINAIAMQIRLHAISWKLFPDTIDSISDLVEEFLSGLPTKNEFQQWYCEDCDWVGRGNDLVTVRLEDRCPKCNSVNVDRMLQE